ncbi:leader peptide SpeFL [Escherichia coli]
MENNNRLMPHIRRTTHIMKFAHRNSFDFHFFNAQGTPTYRSP